MIQLFIDISVAGRYWYWSILEIEGTTCTASTSEDPHWDWRRSFCKWGQSVKTRDRYVLSLLVWLALTLSYLLLIPLVLYSWFICFSCINSIYESLKFSDHSLCCSGVPNLIQFNFWILPKNDSFNIWFNIALPKIQYKILFNSKKICWFNSKNNSIQ